MAESLFLGLGLLLPGLAGNAKDDWGTKKTFVYVGFVSLVIGVILFFYNTFFI